MNKIDMPGQHSCGRGLFVVFALLAGSSLAAGAGSSAIAAGAAIAPRNGESLAINVGRMPTTDKLA
jgi:hypothetical protein